MILSIVFCLCIVLVLNQYGNCCSRETSRKVRDYLKREIFPVLPNEISPHHLPESYQLNPRFDLYQLQEINTAEFNRGDWKCGFCGKHFKNEHFMDRHMENKHQNKLSVSK